MKRTCRITICQSGCAQSTGNISQNDPSFSDKIDMVMEFGITKKGDEPLFV